MSVSKAVLSGGASGDPAVCQSLASALEGILEIVSESAGVIGYHLNDDVATWDEFEEINAANEVLILHAKHGPWVPVSERLPKPGVSVIVYSPCDDLHFDHIDGDCDSGERWYAHGESYEHYCNVGRSGVSCAGPSEEAPYTHWMEIPEPPKEGNK